jgi:cytoskeleton protein RodZ
MSERPHDPVHAGDPGPMTPAERAAETERREPHGPPRLGRVLQEARERAGLDLSSLAEVTHVRRSYLDALEQGRYAELPEDVYTRNFLRLYAQAVSLDIEPVMELYLRERGRALGLTTLEQRLERDRHAARAVRSTPTAPVQRRRGFPLWMLGAWLPTLVLVGVVVALGVWGYNQLFTTPLPATSSVAPTGGEAAADPVPDAAIEVDPPTDVGVEGAAEASPAVGGLAAPAAPGQVAPTLTQVRIDVVTEPPGASVTIDGFPVPGRTPLSGIPVTGREGRVVRAELDGHEPAEVTADLRQDARVELRLEPLAAAPAAAAAAVAGDERLVLTITDTTWLEVYRSTERNVGERLVYTNAQAGATYALSPPVFVYVGNAAGVRVTLDGQDLGTMGSPGAVLGRAFPE